MSDEAMSDAKGRMSKPSILANCLTDSRKSSSDSNGGAPTRFPAQRNVHQQPTHRFREGFSRGNRESAARTRAQYPARNGSSKKLSAADEEIRDYTTERVAASKNKRNALPWFPQYTKCFNKEKYVQATCQFVVCEEDGPFTPYLKDAEKFIEWELIQELRVNDNDGSVNCPICLSVPTAAKMTRCGHIYCWPCILHYLALSDKAWRKCPICYESVYKESLKSVSIVPKASVKQSEPIVFKLMKRLRTSSYAVPCESWSEFEQPAVLNDYELSKWSKIVSCSRPEVAEHILGREQRQLETRLNETDDEPEKVFVQEALEELDKRRVSLRESSAPIATQATSAVQEADVTRGIAKASREVTSYEDAFNESVEAHRTREPTTPTLEDWPPETSSECDTVLAESEEQTQLRHSLSMPAAIPRAPKNDPRFYYFYQAEDGQRVFLHPLNVRMLLSEYGCWNEVPTVVSGKVLELEQLVMDDDVRARFGPLGHLSSTTQFAFCEVRFDKGLVSKSTVGSFQEALLRRKRARNRRIADEKRQDARAELWHKAMMIQSRGVIIPGGLSNLDHADLEIPNETVVPSAQAEVEAAAGASGSGASPPGQDFSFAQMLRYGVSKRRDHLPSAAAATRLEVPSEAAAARDFGADGDELKAPRHQEDFGSFLAAALDGMKVEGPKVKKGKKQKRRAVFQL